MTLREGDRPTPFARGLSDRAISVDVSQYQPGNPEGGEGSLIVPYLNRNYAFCPTTFEEFPKTHGPAGGTGRYAGFATKETGELYQHRVVDRLVQLIEEIRGRKLGEVHRPWPKA